jgi:hypothetical protein
MMKPWTTLKEMLEQESENIRPDLNDLFLSDPDRAKRIIDAAEHGCEGSTHAEIIDDWYDFLDTMFACKEITLETFDAIRKEIDEVSEWHETNGSLFSQVN